MATLKPASASSGYVGSLPGPSMRVKQLMENPINNTLATPGDRQDVWVQGIAVPAAGTVCVTPASVSSEEGKCHTLGKSRTVWGIPHFLK